MKVKEKNMRFPRGKKRIWIDLPLEKKIFNAKIKIIGIYLGLLCLIAIKKWVVISSEFFRVVYFYAQFAGICLSLVFLFIIFIGDEKKEFVVDNKTGEAKLGYQKLNNSYSLSKDTITEFKVKNDNKIDISSEKIILSLQSGNSTINLVSLDKNDINDSTINELGTNLSTKLHLPFHEHKYNKLSFFYGSSKPYKIEYLTIALILFISSLILVYYQIFILSFYLTTISLILGALASNDNVIYNILIDDENQQIKFDASKGETAMIPIDALTEFYIDTVNCISLDEQACKKQNILGWRFWALSKGSFQEIAFLEKSKFNVSDQVIQTVANLLGNWLERDIIPKENLLYKINDLFIDPENNWIHQITNGKYFTAGRISKDGEVLLKREFNWDVSDDGFYAEWYRWEVFLREGDLSFSVYSKNINTKKFFILKNTPKSDIEAEIIILKLLDLFNVEFKVEGDIFLLNSVLQMKAHSKILQNT